jgi:hypothetical protein
LPLYPSLKISRRHEYDFLKAERLRGDQAFFTGIEALKDAGSPAHNAWLDRQEVADRVLDDWSGECLAERRRAAGGEGGTEA